MAQTKYVDAKDSLNVLNENNKGEPAYYGISVCSKFSIDMFLLFLVDNVFV